MTETELSEQRAYAGRLATSHGFTPSHQVAERLLLLLGEIDRLRAQLNDAIMLLGLETEDREEG